MYEACIDISLCIYYVLIAVANAYSSFLFAYNVLLTIRELSKSQCVTGFKAEESKSKKAKKDEGFDDLPEKGVSKALAETVKKAQLGANAAHKAANDARKVADETNVIVAGHTERLVMHLTLLLFTSLCCTSLHFATFHFHLTFTLVHFITLSMFTCHRLSTIRGLRRWKKVQVIMAHLQLIC